MSNLSSRKVISLAILLSFIIVQFLLVLPSVSAQGEIPTPAAPTPTPMLDTPTPAAENPVPSFEAQSITEALTPLASSWSTPINISVTDSSSSSPSIAVDSNGVVHVVWTEAVNNGMEDIFYKYKDETGWSDPINVSNSSMFYSNDPQVVVDSNGRANIVWGERDSDLFSGNTEVFFSQCNGATCSTPVSLSDSPSWHCGKYFPTYSVANEIPILGIDQGNQLLAEWRAYENSELTMPYRVWSSSELPISEAPGCVSRLPSNPERNMGGSRLMGGTPGNFGLVFDEKHSDTNQRVYYTRYFNGHWATPSFLELGGSPDIYMDPTNDELHLTWCSGGNLRYLHVNPTQIIETVPGAACNWYSPIARDINGLMRILWQESGQIYESRKFPEGWSEKVKISQSSLGVYTPDMVADENGGLHLVWRELHNGNWEIFYLADSAYDCSGVTLSSAAKAVLAEVGGQEYCGNHYDNFSRVTGDHLITLPPGKDAFKKFGDLAKTAKYEVDFVTMGWDPARDNTIGNINDSPGEVFLADVKELYEQVKDPVSHGLPADYYSDGVRIRILLGLKYYQPTGYQDQRVIVMKDLQRWGIDGINHSYGWTVEVATYRGAKQYPDVIWGSESSGTHGHVKLMVVDGKRVIVGGYNMHYNYLSLDPDIPPVHDMGVQVSGPIGFRALKVFDELWANAYGCAQYDEQTAQCTEESGVSSSHHEILNVLPPREGSDVVFSLFRTDAIDHKTADNAIAAAIEAADNNVNIIQNRFTNFSFDNPPQYAGAILNVLQKENFQVLVKLLVSGRAETFAEKIDYTGTAFGACMLKYQLDDADASRLSLLQIRKSTADNPIHTKALSIDNSFIIVGSQNFDASAWGDDENLDDPLELDLAEYSLGVESDEAAYAFNTKFTEEWNDATALLCPTDISTLQNEIDQAPPNSSIFIPAGVYNGSITINKPLILVGSGVNQTLIHAEESQPAFRITSSDVVIMNMKISGSNRYGIELVDSSPGSARNIQINHVVFENNAQGGVLIQGLTGGSPTKYTIENNTFIGGAAGITIDMPETQAETSIIRNNIFSGQSVAPVHILSSDDSRVEYSYNLFDDCGAGSCAVNWHLGNLSAVSTEHDNVFDLDPLFVDAANGDYQLSAGSPAIDAGDPSLLHETFYDGDNDGTIRIDIGAFESKPLMISGNVGIEGANLSYADGSTKTATSDIDGNYFFTVPYSWSGMVTPSKAGYIFTPPSLSYTHVTADQTNQDYTASPATYIISGNAGVAGATLSYEDGTAKTATTDTNGDYSFTVSYGWSGAVTPSKSDFTFSPTSKSYTNVLSDQTAQNYTATPIQYTISGNAGVAGATLSYLDGTPKTVTANSSGDYSLPVSYNWSGTVTPSKVGYTFSPANHPYSNVLDDQVAQNYAATAVTYTISGNAGVAGATLSYVDGIAKSATANAGGDYSFTVSYEWSGNVTPSKPGYTFTPSIRNYSNILNNLAGQNYIATPVLLTMSGNVGIGGATLSYVDGIYKTATADASGNYSFTVSYNWSGTVTPSKVCYVFSPANGNYTNVVTNQPGQNYTAQPCGDTIGLFRPGTTGIPGAFYLKNSNTGGFADIATNYGISGDKPVVGDWDGNGTTTIGIYRSGTFYLSNSNTSGIANIAFAFNPTGNTTGVQPIAGDWNGDGIDTIGIYQNGNFYLRNSNSAGGSDISFSFGSSSHVPLAGDWNGDGIDTIGVFYPTNGTISMRNSNTPGGAEIYFNYGVPGDKPLIGDWNSDGIDTIGVYRSNSFYLRNSNTVGFADIVFSFGFPSDMPIAGNWDSLPTPLNLMSSNICIMDFDGWLVDPALSESSMNLETLDIGSMGCDVYLSTEEALEQGLSLENLDILTDPLIIEQAPAQEDGSVTSDNR